MEVSNFSPPCCRERGKAGAAPWATWKKDKHSRERGNSGLKRRGEALEDRKGLAWEGAEPKGKERKREVALERRGGREGIGLLIREGSCVPLSFSLTRPLSLLPSSFHSLRLPSAFQLQLSRPCSFSHLSAGPSVCARMFMRVQETRVRGYANRMIDTLAGCMPSLCLSLSLARTLARPYLLFRSVN